MPRPYLFFEGRCEEAIAFYRRTLRAEVVMQMRYHECPDPPPPGMMPPGTEHKIMHAELRIGDGSLMLSDGHCAGKPSFGGFALSLNARDEADARATFDALGDGGTVRMPLGRTFFSPAFGMVQDRFGVVWMVGVMEQPA